MSWKRWIAAGLWGLATQPLAAQTVGGIPGEVLAPFGSEMENPVVGREPAAVDLAVDLKDTEVLISISGVEKYAQVRELKEMISRVSPTQQPAIEKMLSPGQVVFAVGEQPNLESFLGQISAGSLSQGEKVHFLERNYETKMIEAELK